MSKGQEIEIDEATIAAIAEKVAPAPVDLDAIATKVAENIKEAAEKQDKESNKLDGGDSTPVEGEVVGKHGKLSKEAFAVKQLGAALTGNKELLKELNEEAVKSLESAGLVEKATYLNAGTAADGAVLVPNADLLNDILTLLPAYSPLADKLRTITLTDGNSIDVDALITDVTMTEVGSEGGAKTVTKPALQKSNIAVREWAGIALMTKKLVKQSAIDVYALLRDSFARAIAKTRETMIISDGTSGLVTLSGVTVVNAGGSTTSGKTTVALIPLADIKKMPFSVPTAAGNGGMYVFSRLLLASLASREDSTGQPIVTLNSSNGGTLSGTFNGYPFVVAETLGTTDAVSTVHAIFGNFAEYGFVVRQGAIDTAVFDSGTVTDGGSTVHNLIQENKLAMRVETWEAVGFPLPAAFVRLRTSAS
jgi:HK97 family phage major capsid protein